MEEDRRAILGADVRALAALVPPSQRLCVQNQLGPQLEPRLQKVAIPRCGEGDAQLIMLRAVAPADDGLILRFDTSTLLGEHPLAIIGRLERARRAGDISRRTPRGVYLLAAKTATGDGDVDDDVIDDEVVEDEVIDDEVIDADVARFLEELGARRVAPGPLVELAVGPAKRRGGGSP